jgi:hypothetical protein
MVFLARQTRQVPDFRYARDYDSLLEPDQISFNKDSNCGIDPLRFHRQQRPASHRGLASKGEAGCHGDARGVHNAVCQGRSRCPKVAPYVDKLWTALAVDLRPRPRPSLPPVRFDHGRDGHRHRRPDDPSGQPGAAEQGPAAPRLQHQPHRATGRAGWCNAGRLRHPGCSRSIGGGRPPLDEASAGRRAEDADPTTFSGGVGSTARRRRGVRA